VRKENKKRSEYEKKRAQRKKDADNHPKEEENGQVNEGSVIKLQLQEFTCSHDQPSKLQPHRKYEEVHQEARDQFQ